MADNPFDAIPTRDPFADIPAAPRSTHAADPFADIPVDDKPKTLAGNAIKPITDYPSVYSKTVTKNWNDLKEDLEGFNNPNYAMKAWAALKTLGGIANYVASPAEAAFTSLVGNPFESVTGIKGSGEKIGEYGSFATQLA